MKILSLVLVGLLRTTPFALADSEVATKASQCLEDLHDNFPHYSDSKWKDVALACGRGNTAANASRCMSGMEDYDDYSSMNWTSVALACSGGNTASSAGKCLSHVRSNRTRFGVPATYSCKDKDGHSKDCTWETLGLLCSSRTTGEKALNCMETLEQKSGDYESLEWVDVAKICAPFPYNVGAAQTAAARDDKAENPESASGVVHAN